MSIPHGEAGTDATVSVMRAMIEEGKRDPAIRRLAEGILRHYNVPRYLYVDELAALHDWVRRRIRYTKDPHEVEYIQTPRRLLQSRMGDCDDMAVLLGSLAEVIGHPVGIKVVSRNADRNYHHVYPVAKIDGHEYGLDASVPFPFGYQSPDIKKQKIFSSNGVGDMRSVYSVLGKMPPVQGGDGAEAGGTVIPVMPPSDPDVPAIEVLNVGERICRYGVGRLVAEGRVKAGVGARLVLYQAGPGNPCVKAVLDTLREPSERPTVFLPPPYLRKPSIEPDVYMPPPDLRKPSIEPDVYMPPPGIDISMPGEGKPAIKPDVYMPPPEGTIPIDRRASYKRMPYTTPGGAVAMAEEKGPLGLPWIVWVGAAGLLVTVLMKK